MKKRMVMVTSLMLAVLLIGGGTFAWFTASATPARNDFKAGTLKMGLHDVFTTSLAQNVNPGDCFQKAVWVCNTGTKKMYVRVRVTEESVDGLSFAGVVNYNINTDYWVPHSDGWIYYKYILPANSSLSSTAPLFKLNTWCKKIPSLCFDGEAMTNDFQGKAYSVVIESEAVQTTNGAPGAVWGSPHARSSEGGFDFLLDEELGFEAPVVIEDADVVEE